MKNYATAAILALTLTLSACTTHTEFGPCIGAFDDRDPKLTYKMSAWNVFLSVFFIQTIIVPVLVVTDNARCPVAPK